MGKGFSKDFTYNVDWEEDQKLGEGQYADVYTPRFLSWHLLWN
jgi:hypothetical protein